MSAIHCFPRNSWCRKYIIVGNYAIYYDCAERSFVLPCQTITVILESYLATDKTTESLRARRVLLLDHRYVCPVTERARP
jgi:hypothetical protein